MTWEFTGGDLAASLIALFSLCVAGWFAFRQTKYAAAANALQEQQTKYAAVANALQEQANENQDRLTKIEEARHEEETRLSSQADITLRLINKGEQRRPLEYLLIIANSSAATANEVDIEVLSKDEKQGQFSYDRARFPLPEVPSGGEVSIPATLHRITGEVFNVAVSWNDAAGRHERNRVVVPEQRAVNRRR